jgi:hypothetical protein
MLRRILYLAYGLERLPRNSGGTDFIDVSYVKCGMQKGLRFLNNDRLRKIIHDLYCHKREG